MNATATTPEDAYKLAGQIGFPILLRPSFVLGGRGMFIVYGMDDMKKVVREAFEAAPGKPVLLDKFLEDAIELDVDAISDGETTVIGGMLEHIEYAGVHSATPQWFCRRIRCLKTFLMKYAKLRTTSQEN